MSYSQALEAFEQAGSVRNACIEEVNVAFACIELGRYEEAETRLRRALAAAERMGLQTVQGFAHLNLGRVLMYQGDLEEARRTELVALAIGQREAAPRIEGAQDAPSPQSPTTRRPARPPRRRPAWQPRCSP